MNNVYCEFIRHMAKLDVMFRDIFLTICWLYEFQTIPYKFTKQRSSMLFMCFLHVLVGQVCAQRLCEPRE